MLCVLSIDIGCDGLYVIFIFSVFVIGVIVVKILVWLYVSWLDMKLLLDMLVVKMCLGVMLKLCISFVVSVIKNLMLLR